MTSDDIGCHFPLNHESGIICPFINALAGGGVTSEKQIDIGTRLLKFSASVVKLLSSTETKGVSRLLSNQLLRSSTSVGANYEESRAAQSRADFIHKMQVALKEIRETHYWLSLYKEAELIDLEYIEPIRDEARQLRAILSKAVATAKARSDIE